MYIWFIVAHEEYELADHGSGRSVQKNYPGTVINNKQHSSHDIVIREVWCN